MSIMSVSISENLLKQVNENKNYKTKSGLISDCISFYLKNNSENSECKHSQYIEKESINREISTGSVHFIYIV